MIYIIVLNWNNANDTLACLESLAALRDVYYRVIVCDNASTDDSYSRIRDSWLSVLGYENKRIVELEGSVSQSYKVPEGDESVYLIQTGNNFGYAGGNNFGIRFSLNQNDMEYVWVLNNDTIVAPDSLAIMVNACNKESSIGICGCKIIYDKNRTTLQGLGGIYNPWFGTTKHYAANFPVNSRFNDEWVSSEIDYVIGASILLKRNLLEQVGLLCEEYFLYFEELDLSCRALNHGFRHYVTTSAIVYHKEGATAGFANEKSEFSDMLAIRNRLLFTCKFNKYYIPFVWVSLLGVCFNRLKRLQFRKAINVLKVMFFIR